MTETIETLLRKIRDHRHFRVFIAQLEVDLQEWRAAEGTDAEGYEGEAAERGGLLELITQLLTGKACRKQTHLRLVENDDDAEQ